jgi:hypothetical protein
VARKYSGRYDEQALAERIMKFDSYLATHASGHSLALLASSDSVSSSPRQAKPTPRHERPTLDQRDRRDVRQMTNAPVCGAAPSEKAVADRLRLIGNDSRAA